MSRFRVLAAGMTAAVIAVLAAAVPASAHDELISSSPTPGAVLAEAPVSVTLDFSAEVLTTGAVIVIADARGDDWVAAPAVVQGTTVTADVREDMPDAGYELRWRVVSADGHPISGVIPFTVGDASPLVREQPGTDAGPDATAAVSDGSDGGTDARQTTPEDPVLRTVLIGAGGAGVALALFAVIRFLRRRPTDVDTGDAAPRVADER